jgi:shikimate dehydrogenase
MHEAGYKALGLNFAYVPFGITDVAGALAGMRALGIRGFGVSMPFKLEVMPHLDKLDPLAERIGAVNTIVNDAGVLTGYNTDAHGAATALADRLRIDGSRVMVVGAGGAARAVAYALRDKGAQIHLVNRTPERAEALANAVGGTSGGLADLARLDDFDALVNASSAGMKEYGDALPIPESAIRAGLVVMDIVYKPLKTPLLELAARRGATTIDGARMLLHQAARQFALYTLARAPLEIMDAALRKKIASTP